METQFLTFTGLAIIFIIAIYLLYTRRVERERDRYQNAARHWKKTANKNYDLYAKQTHETKRLQASVSHWKKTAESNYDLYVKAIQEMRHYRGVSQTREVEADEAKRDLTNMDSWARSRDMLLKKLSENKAYTRTSPERHWRRQDKLLELKFRNSDGSYEQF